MLISTYIKTILTYNNGELFWNFRENRSKAWNTRWNGKKAGYFDKSSGYIKIVIDKKIYYAHRIVALIHNMSGDEIDHIDCNRVNNSISNLRPSTRFQNMSNKNLQSNNKSGIKGISYLRSKNRSNLIIRANVTHNKKQYYKYFKNTIDNLAEAEKWVINTRKRLHGNFVNNG